MCVIDEIFLQKKKLLKQTNWGDEEGCGVVLLLQIRLGLTIPNLMLSMKKKIPGMPSVQVSPNVTHFDRCIDLTIQHHYDREWTR